MYLLQLPHFDPPRKLVYYLSVEEYLSDNLEAILPDDGAQQRAVYFLWGSTPTVIFGRNQDMEAEVDVAYCREHGIDLYRRKSGGGCVYSDEGNIMISFVCSDTDVAAVFSSFQDRLCVGFRNLGLPATRSERNDVLLDGKKVCGGAFRLLPRCSIVHSTLLFDSDFSVLERAITPSATKLGSKGVKSVRQHVANVVDFLTASPDPAVRELCDKDRFLSYLGSSLTGGGPVLRLSRSQLSAVDAVEKTYLDPGFILQGRSHTGRRLVVTGRFPRCGEVECTLGLGEDDTIVSFSLRGDFFSAGSRPLSELESLLVGCPLRREAVEARMSGTDPGQYIVGMGREEFLDLFPFPDGDRS